MKIAISASSESLDKDIAEVFGRCPYFIIAEVKDGKIGKTEAIKNKSEDQMSGAGVSTVQLLAENDVNVVIAKNVGPRALDALKQFDIKLINASGRVVKALDDFIKEA